MHPRPFGSPATGPTAFRNSRLIRRTRYGWREKSQTQAAILLAKRYAGSAYVSVMPLDSAAAKGGKIEPEALNETNRLELYVFASGKYPQALLVARLDNLGKGASGAAVQNMRLMLGFAD